MSEREPIDIAGLRIEAEENRNGEYNAQHRHPRHRVRPRTHPPMTPDPKIVLTKAEFAVFELRQLRRLSLRQTAHALDLSISTIRSTEERIERKLRRAA